MCHPFHQGLVWISLVTAMLVGCGSAPSEDVSDQKTAAAPVQAAAPDIPPPAAISAGNSAAMDAKPARVVAEPGSPEALLMQIAGIVSEIKADVERQQADEAAGVENSSAAESYQEHLQQIVELATQVVAATHLDPDAEQAFNNAVLYLSDARLELASLGDAAQARLLLEDADSLYERDKQSFAAAEASFKVVQLAERMARSLGGQDAEWLNEYATQANHFAERFPDETPRAAMALFTAGRLCDRYQLTEPARQCLERVQLQFAETVFAEQSAGILRRLSLRGQPLELAGPTIDGGFADITQYQGHVVLVAFWSSTSPTFLEQLPVIKELEAEFSPQKFAVIGVNLDEDEAAVDAFLTEHAITWPQIFAADPAQRGGRNPVARYYGVQILPTLWLVAPDGVVAADRVDVANLRETIAGLLPSR